MKTCNTALAIAGLVMVVVGCAIHDLQPLTDPVARYVLSFDKVKLKSPAGPGDFKKALRRAHPRWQKSVVLHYGGSIPDENLPDIVETPSATPPILYTSAITQSVGNPDSLHVTQKIGLNKRRDLDAILSTIEEQ